MLQFELNTANDRMGIRVKFYLLRFEANLSYVTKVTAEAMVIMALRGPRAGWLRRLSVGDR
jgi:hypothetical protein